MFNYNKYNIKKEYFDNDLEFYKSFLIATDYEIIKSYELGIELDPDLKAARQYARDRINELEEQEKNV